LYCSDKCRKQAWRVANRPYYARVRKEAWEKQKAANRRDRKYKWVEEGKEDVVPEFISLAEAMAQATPEQIAQVKELLGSLTDIPSED
jgi:hypothetical protein